MIFGHLLTSSNYDDDEERMTSGRNGLGIKLTNVLVKHLQLRHLIQIIKKFLRKLENNMRESDPHKVTSCSNKTGYTEVSWSQILKIWNGTL